MTIISSMNSSSMIIDINIIFTIISITCMSTTSINMIHIIMFIVSITCMCIRGTSMIMVISITCMLITSITVTNVIIIVLSSTIIVIMHAISSISMITAAQVLVGACGEGFARDKLELNQ